MLVSQCNLDGVEVLTLDILHESHLHDGLVLHGADIRRNALQASYLRSPPSALTGNNLVFAILHLSEGHRLYDTNLPYAARQFLQCLLVEFPSRLVGVGRNLVNSNLVEIRRSLSSHLAGVNQCVESASVANVVKSSSEDTAVVFLMYCHK